MLNMTNPSHVEPLGETFKVGVTCVGNDYLKNHITYQMMRQG